MRNTRGLLYQKLTREYYSGKNTAQLVSRLETDRRGQLRRPLRAPSQVRCNASVVLFTAEHLVSLFVGLRRGDVLFDVSVSYRNRGKSCSRLQR